MMSYLLKSFDDIVKDMEKNIILRMTHWLGPNFFTFFPATVSSTVFVGEMLCTMLNLVGFNWLACPAATELKMGFDGQKGEGFPLWGFQRGEGSVGGSSEVVGDDNSRRKKTKAFEPSDSSDLLVRPLV